MKDKLIEVLNNKLNKIIILNVNNLILYKGNFTIRMTKEAIFNHKTIFIIKPTWFYKGLTRIEREPTNTYVYKLRYDYKNNLTQIFDITEKEYEDIRTNVMQYKKTKELEKLTVPKIKKIK